MVLASKWISLKLWLGQMWWLCLMNNLFCKQWFYLMNNVLSKTWWKRLPLLRGQSSDMYIGVMTNLWPQKSSWHLHRRYGTIFFFYDSHQKDQFETNLVKIRAFWICYPCRGVSKSLTTPDQLRPISRIRKIWQM